MPEFFETRMGQHFYDGTMPRIAKALETIADAVADRERLAAIAALMSGKEWNADTLDAIAAVVRGAGFTIDEVR